MFYIDNFKNSFKITWWKLILIRNNALNIFTVS